MHKFRFNFITSWLLWEYVKHIIFCWYSSQCTNLLHLNWRLVCYVVMSNSEVISLSFKFLKEVPCQSPCLHGNAFTHSNISNLFSSQNFIYHPLSLWKVVSNDNGHCMKNTSWNELSSTWKLAWDSFNWGFFHCFPSFIIVFLYPMQSNLPPDLEEYQRLRCRVAFHALQFRQEVQELAAKIMRRSKSSGFSPCFFLLFLGEKLIHSFFQITVGRKAIHCLWTRDDQGGSGILWLCRAFPGNDSQKM